MYKGPKSKEKLKSPSELFKSAVPEVVAKSFLFHRSPEKQNKFRKDLTEALDDPDRSADVLAGLREAGLRSITVSGNSRIFIRGLNLANPEPEEFSSKVLGAMHKINQDPLEVLAEQGRQELADQEKIQGFNEWLCGMEVAISHTNNG